MPKQENARACWQATVAGLQGGGKPDAKAQHVNGEGSEAVKESLRDQEKPDWAGLMQESMENLCWNSCSSFSLVEGLFFFSASFIFVVHS